MKTILVSDDDYDNGAAALDRSTPETRKTATTVRATTEGKDRILSGIAIPFDSWSCDLGGFKEQCAPGAFKDTLSRHDCDVAISWQHDDHFVFGRLSNDKVTLHETAAGLWFSCVIPSVQWASDIADQVERRDLYQMSIAFTVTSDAWKKDYSERRLLSVILKECSIVAFPAYLATSVSCSSGTWKGGKREALDREADAAIEWALLCREADALIERR